MRKERCFGPYQHGARWRVVVVDANGKKSHANDGSGGPDGFTTREAALDWIDGFRRAAEGRTISEAIAEFCLGKKSGTDGYRLRGLLGLPAKDGALSSLTVRAVRDAVTRRTADVSHDTIIGEISVGVRFGTWCVARGWLDRSPFEGVTPPEGQRSRSRGKPQLRIDDARAFLRFAESDPSDEMTAVLTALLMGLRAHEICERVVADVDDGGRVLVIPKSKTKAGERTVLIPPMLRPRYAAIVVGKGPTDRLFHPTNPRKKSEASRHWLHYHACRLIAAAGLPRVTPHGLRGTFATMALVAGLPGYDPSGGGNRLDPNQLAGIMGHESSRVTLGHYAAPGSAQSAAVQSVASVVESIEIKADGEPIYITPELLN